MNVCTLYACIYYVNKYNVYMNVDPMCVISLYTVCTHACDDVTVNVYLIWAECLPGRFTFCLRMGADGFFVRAIYRMRSLLCLVGRAVLDVIGMGFFSFVLHDFLFADEGFHVSRRFSFLWILWSPQPIYSTEETEAFWILTKWHISQMHIIVLSATDFRNVQRLSNSLEFNVLNWPAKRQNWTNIWNFCNHATSFN